MNTLNVVESVFFAALEKNTPEARAAYLDEACVADANLRRCVERLLNAHPNAEGFLQAPADDDSGTVDEPPLVEKPGTVIGPYKLLQQLGEGGFGVVFLAEQEHPVRRKVALKIIKPGMDSKQVVARFEAERQALAMMDHPNIARVLDVGTTDSGRPYFVMELVKGVPITEFCDQNRLTPRERLELFVPVCQAVQHAHLKGIIHRDLKPSNVLVTMYDDKPVPKVIDFGVAKAIEQKLTEQTLFTRVGQVIGTLEYMSPEQASLNALDVDTRSDIYALGVLLYELLTGTPPLNKERLQGVAFMEVLRLVREEEPPRPSTRLSQSGGGLPLLAAYRKSDSQKLPKLMRGELDWIAMKALDKDRGRRYATAHALAADVQRYLKDEAVEACPPSVGYRLQKYGRKHKTAVGMAGMAAALMLFGIVATSWQALRATDAERVAVTRQRDAEKAQEEEAAQRKIADDERDRTRTAYAELERNQKEMRVNQYAWDMQVLPNTLEAGNVVQARRMLERQLPKPGEADLRGFEWRFWDRQTHSELASVALVPRPNINSGFADVTRHWVFSGDGGRVALAELAGGGLSGGGPIKVTVWDAASRKVLLSHSISLDKDQVRTLPLPGYSQTFQRRIVGISRDGKRLLVTAPYLIPIPQLAPDGQRTTPQARRRNLIVVVDVQSDKELFNSRSDPGLEQLGQAILSRDGRKLVTKKLTPPIRAPGAPAARTPTPIQVWDLENPDKKPVIIDDGDVFDVSPDGSRIVGGVIIDGKWQTREWNTATGAELHRWDYPVHLTYSPDAALLAGTAYLDADGPGWARTLKVYDSATGKELSSLPLPNDMLRPAAVPPGVSPGILAAHVFFSPDNSLLVAEYAAPNLTGGQVKRVWLIVDPRAGKVRCSMDAPGVPTGNRHLSLTMDGKQLIYYHAEVIQTFALETGRPHLTLRGHGALVEDCVPASDGGRLRSIDRNGTFKEWDLHAADPVTVTFRGADGPGGLGRDVAVSADGTRLACLLDKENIEVRDVDGKGATVLKPRPRETKSASIKYRWLQPGPVFSGDGKRVALYRPRPASPFGNVEPADPAEPPIPADLTVWDVASGNELFHIQSDANREVLSSFALTHDGAAVAIVVQERTANMPSRTLLKILDVSSRRERLSIAVQDDLLPRLSFSPDGKRIAGEIRTPLGSASPMASKLAVWDTSDGSQTWVIKGRTPNLPVAWSPDGTRLAVFGWGGPHVALLDAATGKPAITLDSSARFPVITGGHLVFSPDGRRLAYEVQNRFGPNFVSVWDTHTGKELLTLASPSVLGVGASLAFTADGFRLRCFTMTSVYADRTDPGAARPRRVPTARRVLVTTWDATPRGEEPKQP